MLTNVELGEYLKKIREGKNISLREAEKLTGIGYSHLSMIENGKRNVTPALLRNLANIYNVDYIELYEKAGYIDLVEKEHSNKRLLPVLGTVKAGYNYLAQENIIDYIEPHMNLANPEEYFGLIVKGDSMSPLFDEGDFVIVHKQDDFESNNICIILINGDEATIKKVTKTTEGIELHCFNPYYPSRKYTFEQMNDFKIKIIGVVEQQIRNWK